MPARPHPAGPSVPVGGSSPSGHRDGIVTALLVCVAATLIVVVGVIVTGAVAQWWILAPVMLVVIAVSFGVFIVVSRMRADLGD